MENLTITYDTILSFFGALAIIGGGLKIIISLFNPFKELKERLNNHDTMLDNDNRRFKELTTTLERIEEGQRVQGRALMELLNHNISGNDTEKLKKRYQEMVDFYIDM